MIPVNPKAEEIGGEKCYPDLNSVKEMVGAALIMTPSSQVPAVVASAADSGIKNLWIQQGAQSDEAAALGAEKGLNMINGECIIMFTGLTGFLHRFHHWVWKILGKLPQ